MIRAFIALPVNDDVKKKIVHIINTLKPVAGNVGWVNKDDLHITLKFLGSVDDQQIQRAKAAIDTLKTVSAFNADLFGIGAFPSIARPRVLWIGIKQYEKIKAMFDSVETAIVDINKENRLFSAHITIGRVKGIFYKQELEKVRKLWDNKTIGSTVVNRAALFQSILTPEGAVYRVLHEINLKKEAL